MTKYSVSIIRLEREPTTAQFKENIEAGRIERTFDQYKQLMFFVNSYFKRHGYKPHELFFMCLQDVSIYADSKLMIVLKEHDNDHTP